MVGSKLLNSINVKVVLTMCLSVLSQSAIMYDRCVCQHFLRLQRDCADDNLSRSPGRGSPPTIFTLDLSGESLVSLGERLKCIREFKACRV